MFFCCCYAEVIFEPDTEVKVISIALDPKLPDVMRIRVAVADTQPVLSDVVASYEKDSLLPPNWIVRMDLRTGRKYYANLIAQTTQWEFPSF